jgi:RNA polymerase sigma factor FliA
MGPVTMHTQPATDRSADLIGTHAAMARRIALSVARRVPRWIDPDDLIGAALVGLAEAASRFDASRADSFEAFAAQRIRGAVLDELRRGDTLSRRDRMSVRKLRALVSRLEHQLGRSPDDEEIAASAGLEVETCRELLAGASARALELDETVGQLELPEQTSPLTAFERAELVKNVVASLGCLDARDSRILLLYYGEELTFAQIGALLSVTESRVCQLHGRALVRLRTALGRRCDQPELAARRPGAARRRQQRHATAAHV